MFVETLQLWVFRSGLFTDGVDAGTVITLGLGLGSCKVDLPDQKWGQLFYAHDFRGGSPTPALTGLTLLCGPGRVKGLLS